MLPVTLEEFFKDFNKAILDKKKDLSDVYQDRRKYTERMKKILKGLYKSPNYKYAPEWLTIDHTWWFNESRKKEVSKVHIYDWGECILAVEHENDWQDWTYELMKLDAVHASVKVVIGYSNNRDSEQKIIEEQKKYLHLNVSEQVGVILLNRDKKDADDPFEAKLYKITKEGINL